MNNFYTDNGSQELSYWQKVAIAGKKIRKTKGVLLCGGHGTRLYPLTKCINKHLLPVNGKPMAQWAIEELVKAGVTEILVVSGIDQCGSIIQQFGSGKELGCSLTYKVQDEAGGIAQALLLAREFAGDDQVCVILGDNIFDFGPNGLKNKVIEPYLMSSKGAAVVTCKVKDPSRFGVMKKNAKGRFVEIEEKPAKPTTDLAVIGIYMYDPDVYDIIQTLKPSSRGELEITDVNNSYLKRDDMLIIQLDEDCFWSDAGTHESYKFVNQNFNKEDA